MKNRMATIAAALTIGIIAGCGGGASSPTPSATISGAVADGYLVGATVFLDRNNNYQMDADEPHATTDANGAYTLTVAPSDIGNYPVVALATQGVTVDKDTGAAVASSYLLSMPKESVSGTVNSNFISPMSTTVRELMATGVTMQQAMDLVRTQLGLPAGTNMMADFIASNGTSYQTMHDAATNMAALMGNQMGQVMTGTGSGTSVDVNRYRNMMGTIFSNISSVRHPGAGTQSFMSTMTSTMTTTLSNMTPHQPYRNMSSAFRSGMGSATAGMMGGTLPVGVPMMGGGTSTGSSMMNR